MIGLLPLLVTLSGWFGPAPVTLASSYDPAATLSAWYGPASANPASSYGPIVPLAAWTSPVARPAWYGPVVPNKVADKYVPASYQDIGGYLGYRLDINLQKRLLHIDTATILAGFEHRPGAQTWIGEHVGKFLFSASKMYAYSHDPQLKQLMNAVVHTYIACQMPDGYLGTYLYKDRWTEWDVWAHKYAIIGLVNYYSVTGYKPALEAAQRAADLICRTFGDDPANESDTPSAKNDATRNKNDATRNKNDATRNKNDATQNESDANHARAKRDLMQSGEHNGLAPGSILEPMVDLYRYTGNPKYLAFCRYILRAYEQPDGPRIISNLERSADVTKVGDAKAYEMLSCFLGILKYYKLTGEEKYLHALQAAWTDIVTHRLYITGTASDHEVFVGTGILKATNADLMGEGCVTVTWMQFNLALLQITGDLKYSAEMERSVYNQLLAAEDPQTGCVSYYTALMGAKPYRCNQGFSCCLSSVPRAISLIPEMIGGKIDDTFTVLLYENGTATTTIRPPAGPVIPLTIKSSTRFPADGLVTLSVDPDRTAAFTINLRVPDWAQNFSAVVDGHRYSAEVAGQNFAGAKNRILPIKRTWKKGDKIKINFTMPVQVLPGGLSYPHSVAFQRGPQVLALDKTLNPGVDTLSDITYPSATVPAAATAAVAGPSAPALRESAPTDSAGGPGPSAPARGPSLTDATAALPPTWGWKEAFYLDARIGDTSKKVMLVPFAEAGQTTGDVAVWVTALQ